MGGAVSTEDLNDFNFNNGQGEDLNSLADGSGDEDGTGSSNDPEDYFSRINKSDSIF